MAEYVTKQMKDVLTLADNYAKQHSTCDKTAVGCYIVAETEHRFVLAKGANCGEVNCKEYGCLRKQLYGNNSKEHRNVCRCIHSEIDALMRIPEDRLQFLTGATAFVTRYPCDDCTKALVDAGIKKIVYGRPFPMSQTAMTLCSKNGVRVSHVYDWNCDENDTNN